MHGPLPSRWDDLRVFLAVLRTGSFSAAAKELGIEQSTVSRRIATLEQDLRTTLFERSPSGPVPTLEARRSRAQAERIESEMHAFAELVRDGNREVEGRVRLATTESFAVQVLIPRALADLAKRHPKLALDLVLGDTTADLARRQADIALRFFRPQGGDLVAKRIARLPMSVLAHRDYARRSSLDPKSLDWIVLDLPGTEMADAAFVREHVGVDPRMRMTSHLAQVEAVRSGLGAALLVDALRGLDPDLVEVPLGLPLPPPVELWLVAPRALRKVRRVAAVWTFLEQSLARLDGGEIADVGI